VSDELSDLKARMKAQKASAAKGQRRMSNKRFSRTTEQYPAQNDAGLRGTDVPPKEAPKCEECVSHQPSEISYMSDTCQNVGKRYVYSANERSKDGTCGPTARLFKRRAG
jgi:hypothetical protein